MGTKIGRRCIGAVSAMLLAVACSSSGSGGTSSDASQTGSGGAGSGNGGGSGTSGNDGVSGNFGNGGTTGGSANGGAHTGGSVSSGGTNSGGGGVASGGSPSTGGGSQAGGHGGDASVGGAAGADGSSNDNLCGAAPCLPTRCAGKGCGPAVCCQQPNGPVCFHGASSCSEADGGSGRQALECFDRSGSGDFSKACTRDQDCFVAQHWAGCCRIQAIGLNVAEKAPFDTFESSCGGMPPCGCCCDRATTDDGMNVASSTSISVACVAGECTTRSP